RPDREGTLSHTMVQAEWSGRLIYRRKLYPPELRGTLRDLLALRQRADYREADVSPRRARSAAAESERLVSHVVARLMPPQEKG
ncbi:MAG: hypothetical protein ACRDI2_15945, partial [Chloroflexota bacterium]